MREKKDEQTRNSNKVLFLKKKKQLTLTVAKHDHFTNLGSRYTEICTECMPLLWLLNCIIK